MLWSTSAFAATVTTMERCDPDPTITNHGAPLVGYCLKELTIRSPFEQSVKVTPLAVGRAEELEIR
jgi:hypothetical protein